MSGLSITNSVAQQSVMNLNNSRKQLDSVMMHMSTGRKINGSGENPAGFIIGNQMSSIISEAGAAMQNVRTLQSLLNTADGVAAAVSGHLDRMQEIATLAQGTAFDATSLGAIQAEFQSLGTTISTTLSAQQFNGRNFADGSLAANYVVGAGSTSRVMQVNLAAFNLAATTFGDLATTAIASPDDGATAVGLVETARTALAGAISSIGQYQKSVSITEGFLASFTENMKAANSAMVDADLAQEAADFTSVNLVTNGAAAMLAKANKEQTETVDRLLQQL